MKAHYDLVIIGLSISSSWGNGHATTYRSLVKGLAQQEKTVLFIERDVPWYASNRDLAAPEDCDLVLYRNLDELDAYRRIVCAADAVMIGSYVPEGQAVIARVASWTPRLLTFYDIDTPVTLAAMARGEQEFIAARQMPLFDIYFSFSGGEVLNRLETQFGVRRAVALYCSVDPDLYQPTGATHEWDLGYLGTYSPDRQPTLERLLLEPARRLPDRRFVVAGARYPDYIEWPPNVARIEHLPPSGHAEFYGRQRYTLNVTREDMIAAGWSPSVRLFEAAASGTPLISDRWRGIEELLPLGEAIVIADTSEDIVELIESSDDERRSAYAKQARSIVLRGHTGRARAKELIDAIEGAGFRGEPTGKRYA